MVPANRPRPVCEKCGRPAALTVLYSRNKASGVAVMTGRYGPACLYRIARLVAKHGFQPEREDTRPIRLKGV